MATTDPDEIPVLFIHTPDNASFLYDAVLKFIGFVVFTAAIGSLYAGYKFTCEAIKLPEPNGFENSGSPALPKNDSNVNASLQGVRRNTGNTGQRNSISKSGQNDGNSNGGNQRPRQYGLPSSFISLYWPPPTPPSNDVRNRLNLRQPEQVPVSCSASYLRQPQICNAYNTSPSLSRNSQPTNSNCSGFASRGNHFPEHREYFGARNTNPDPDYTAYGLSDLSANWGIGSYYESERSSNINHHGSAAGQATKQHATSLETLKFGLPSMPLYQNPAAYGLTNRNHTLGTSISSSNNLGNQGGQPLYFGMPKRRSVGENIPSSVRCHYNLNTSSSNSSSNNLQNQRAQPLYFRMSKGKSSGENIPLSVGHQQQKNRANWEDIDTRLDMNEYEHLRSPKYIRSFKPFP